MAASISLELDADLQERVESLAVLKQRSAASIMREAIAQYVEREEQTEVFNQATIEAWEEYQKTGLHLTAAEVKEWLSSWGPEDVKASPKCYKS